MISVIFSRADETDALKGPVQSGGVFIGVESGRNGKAASVSGNYTRIEIVTKDKSLPRIRDFCEGRGQRDAPMFRSIPAD